jgi:Tol biopolymer transport system component
MKPGARLGPYEIVAMLGAGGMGEVYRARDTRLDREVAVKILPPEFAQNAELRARFEREARSISSISDPHICALYDIGEADVDDGAARQRISYIVMEYLEGESLAARIARGPLPLDQCLRYGAETADALSAAHRRGVVHRDLKPGNVMITASGAKLLDFGLAKPLRDRLGESVSVAVDAPTTPVTRAGMIIGTLQYMAPEQLEGREADARTDIFALGVVLYEMATGRRAFVGTSEPSLASSILRDEPKPISESAPMAPHAFDRVVRRCLAKDPEERWQSARDVAAELREIRDDVSSGRLHEEVVVAPPVPKGRVSRFLVAGALALLVVAVVAGSWLWLSRREKPAVTVAPPRAEVVQLTAQPGVEWFPSLSPDGKWIVYAGTKSGRRHILLQSVGGLKPVDLTEDSPGDDDQPAFSPDGEQIAFRSSREGGGIFVMGRTGEAVRRVTRAGFKPAWSPDGMQLAYTSESVELNPQNAAGHSDLFVVPVAGGEPRRVGSVDAVLANWSPNGKRIAITSRIRKPFQLDILTIPVSGGTPEPVTNDLTTDWNPAWSPDGKYLYFASDRGGSMNLWRVAIDESSGKPLGQPEPITSPAPFLAHPSISADGRLIAYTSALVTANIQCLQLDLDAAEPRGDPMWLTTGSRRWSSPDPSPDGEWVAFYSLTQPEGDVFVVRADGTALRQVTGDDAVDRLPRWSPDGRWLSFFSNRNGPLEVWKVRADGSELGQVTEGGGAYHAWSPDGMRMVTVGATDRDTNARPARVFDPSRPWKGQRIEELPVMDPIAPPFQVNSWSPDGARLTGSHGPSAQGIVLYDFRTRKFELLTDFGEWPVWLPDSRRILFGDGGKAFHVIDSRTKEVRKIFSADADVIGPPRISRNGLACYSRRVTETDIWLATLK